MDGLEHERNVECGCGIADSHKEGQKLTANSSTSGV